jgi:hypothetical protein
MAAGTVTATEERLANVHKITFAWTAGTGADEGTASGVTTYPYNGVLLRAVTVPGGAPNAPTDDYDITITDADGIDIANGQLLNRDEANTEWRTASMGSVVGDVLTCNVTAAGAAKTGTCIIYIGLMPEMADPVTAIADALYGTTGIATFPAAAAAANNVSLAEVIRYIQASQIGTLANTGGTATLAGILGDPANVSLATTIGKITGAATGGLAVDANNSLAYRVAEIERHLHSYEKWFGVAGTPSATHKADRVGQAIVAFQVDGGNLVFGSWVQILGTDDTTEKYDLHKMFVTDVQETAPYFIQLAFGPVANDAVTAGAYTELVLRVNAINSDRVEIPLNTRRQAAGTLAWARCLALGTNTGTLDFYFGLHTYEG